MSSFRLFIFFGLVLIFSCTRHDNKSGTKTIDKNTLIEVNRILMEKDKARIISYIKQKNWKMQESPLGFWYSLVEDTEGPAVKKGDLVTLQYSENLLDGTVCYSNFESTPRTIKMGYNEITKGLDEGLYYMNRGDSAIFIIPPFLAYGLPGDGKIVPPRSVVVYHVKVMDIKHPK